MAQDSINHGSAPNWEPLLARPALTPLRKMRVVAIGAGFSGLTLAWKIQHELKLEDEIELTIYEKNKDVGGTWYENRYPGLFCDVPSHSYCFPFEPNPDWTTFYSSQPEVLAYMKKTAEKYDLYKHVKLATSVKEAVWDESSGKWKLKIEYEGQTREDEADFLINCCGWMNQPKMPKIKGLQDFKGKLVHCAHWDASYDWQGKKVAVLGNGASGIQVVPAMQPKVDRLVNYVRQPTWISAKTGFEATPHLDNLTFTEEQKEAWRRDPEALIEHMKTIEKSLNGFYFGIRLDSPVQSMVEQAIKANMEAFTADDPELLKRMMPTTFKPGCRRLTPGNAYLKALQQPNCRDEWDPIECFTEKGIKTVSGREEEFDMIVCATGYDTSNIPPWKLVGRNGATLDEMWKDAPRAFFSTQVEDMPNYGMLTGPNGPTFTGPVQRMEIWICDYLLRWIRKMNQEDIKSLVVTKEAVDDYNEYIQEIFKLTVYSGDCRSFYNRGKSDGPITGNYPGTATHLKNGLDQVGGEHFDITWRSKNRFRWLGDGTAISDKYGAGDMAPYLT